MAVDYHEYIKSEAWRQRAEAAKQRVGHRCQICNRPAPRVTLDVLHRTYERLGNEHPEDLTVLCRGCYELYEKNRRIPSPPSAQSLPAQPQPPAPTAAVTAQPSKQPVALNGVAPRRPFAPARINPQRATLPVEEAETALRLLPKVDSRYALAAEAASPAAARYHLTTADEQQLTITPEERTSPTNRREWMVMAFMVAITVLLVVSLYNVVTLTPNALRPLAESQQPPATRTAAPPTVALTAVAAVATSLPTPTAGQEATPLQPTPPPTMRPTLTPTLPPTPTSAPATVEPTPQRTVLRTGLVCGNPCSCAPVIRTITQGTPVTVLNTQLCGSDMWYQIGEAEWLGPGLIDPK